MIHNGNARLVNLAECFAVAGGAGLAVAVSSDVAVAEHPFVRVVFGVGMVAAWIVLLAAERTSDARVLGRGFEEYRRVLLGTAKLLGLLAVVLLVTGVPLPRQTLVITFTAGLGGCLLAHLLNAIYLRHQRLKSAEALTWVLLVGTAKEASRVTAAISSDRRAGYVVIGFHPLATHAPVKAFAGGLPELHDEDPSTELTQIVDMAVQHHAGAVIVTSAERMEDGWLRDLRWGLHPFDIDLMVMPDVAGIAQPKLSVERLGGLSLLRVDHPGYSSASALGKAVFDRVMSMLMMLAASPVLILIALAIKLEDGGPIFYRQTRVGLNAKPFRMWKFRSMHPDAESRLAEVRKLSGMDDAAFYKWANDPRITRVGKVLRHTSLDELPQLFNVAIGQMSLIGPRPMLEGEGKEFPGFVQRRLSVKPGMTGLWQTSGRSDLSEQERVRLDLYYVENWSIDQDLRILLKTAVTVARGVGAH